ncbi:MAG: hypothetical protein JW908_12130 [Anaerolineales bacterium]|nr:hypothetical protein [Anaerolineales bacterium]
MFDFLFPVDAVMVDTVDPYGICFGMDTACLNITSCMGDAVDLYGIFLGKGVSPASISPHVGADGVRPSILTLDPLCRQFG